jgi:hypothetical protein
VNPHPRPGRSDVVQQSPKETHSEKEDNICPIVPGLDKNPGKFNGGKDLLHLIARVNQLAGHVELAGSVKEKKKSSFLVLLPPKTLKSPTFDHIGGAGGGGLGGGISPRPVVTSSTSNTQPKLVDNSVPQL